MSKAKLEQFVSGVITLCKPYSLIIAIFLALTIYFFIVDVQALSLAIRTIGSGNTLVQIIKSQHFAIGAGIGFVVMVIMYFTLGIGRKENIRTTLFHIILMVFLLVWTSILIDSVYINAKVENIIKWSQALMHADKTVFGVYPAFFMFSHYNIVFERIIINAYNFLPLIAGLWTGYLLITQKIGELEKWFKSIFLALAIAIPLWILVPAMEPLTSYVLNIFKQPIPADIYAEIVKGPPSTYLLKYTTAYQNMWLDKDGVRHAVSNFPSMHTIWGFLIVFSTWRIFRKKWLTGILTFIAVANMIGAVYLLQHFAVDLIASFCVLGVIHLWIKREETI